MNNYQCAVRKLRLSEYQTLRKTTGWDSIQDEKVELALKNDLFSICVLEGKNPIGIGRVIGDGAIYFYVQDVIVLPEYKKRNIGSLIMDHIEKYLKENAPKNSFIGLMAAKGVKGFYKKYGYKERAPESPGMYKRILS